MNDHAEHGLGTLTSPPAGTLLGSLTARVTPMTHAPSARRGGLAREPSYVIRPAATGGWCWLLRSHDAEVVAAAATPTSTPGGANVEALWVRITAAAGPTDVVTDRHGGWHWRLLTRAGQVVAVSAIGFATHWAAELALDRFRHDASHAELADEGPPQVAAQ